MRSRVFTTSRLLRLRGPGYLLYLLTGCALPRLAHELLLRVGPRRLRLLAAVAGTGLALAVVLGSMTAFGANWGLRSGGSAAALLALGSSAGFLLLRWRRRHIRLAAARRATSAPGGFFLAWSDWPVTESVRRAVEAVSGSDRTTGSKGEVVLGHIDGDGRLESPWGELPDFEPVSAEDFVPRTRYTLDLVLLDGRVLIRKDYRGRRAEFLDEWYVLGCIRGRANVPAPYVVEEDRCRIYRSFIPGDTINDRLVKSGARIRLVETHDDAELHRLSDVARLEAILERGTRRLSTAVPRAALEELERQLDLVHGAGVARLSLTFGNVVLDNHGAPWLVDFDGARAYRSTRSAAFAYRRDQDRVKLNRFYGRNLMTEAQARRDLAERFGRVYAPIDLGQGLVTRGFWSVDSGTGRWEILLRDALGGLVVGQRILDLGSHHALLPLLMLTAGARQVVALEKSSELVSRARLLRRLFEWRHMKELELDLRCADMRAILDGDWGSFGLVTAFCSLYYLEEDDMRRVVRKAAALAPIMVLQAKVDTRTEAADNKAVKSSLAFLTALLEDNGFPEVELIAPPGYPRPLLVGRKQLGLQSQSLPDESGHGS